MFCMKSKKKNIELEDIKHEGIEHEIEMPQNENSKKKLKYPKKNSEFGNEDNDKDEKMRMKNEDENKDEDEDKNEYKDKDKDMKVKKKDKVTEEHCSDATYLARQMIIAERLSQDDMIKLYKLHVELRHKVPPQHKIETRAGSHMPTQAEMRKFEEIVPCRKGVYSCDEDDIIVRNWKAFCKIHDWEIKKTAPFLQLRVGTMTHMRSPKERRKFVQFLADGLPNRTLYSVYHRFRTLQENNKNVRYTREEDEMILDHLENNPSLDRKRKYADLARVLKRTRHSIWRRYQILKKKKMKLEDM